VFLSSFSRLEFNKSIVFVKPTALIVKSSLAGFADELAELLIFSFPSLIFVIDSQKASKIPPKSLDLIFAEKSFWGLSFLFSWILSVEAKSFFDSIIYFFINFNNF